MGGRAVVDPLLIRNNVRASEESLMERSVPRWLTEATRRLHSSGMQPALIVVATLAAGIVLGSAIGSVLRLSVRALGVTLADAPPLTSTLVAFAVLELFPLVAALLLAIWIELRVTDHGMSTLLFFADVLAFGRMDSSAEFVDSLQSVSGFIYDQLNKWLGWLVLAGLGVYLLIKWGSPLLAKARINSDA